MKFYTKCRCGCSVLCIEKIFDRFANDKITEPAVYYFNMYRSCDKGGFWYRLKCAWKYFRSGEFAWSDMTIEDGDIEGLITFLTKSMASEEVHQ